jgi:hypothetical protein
MNAAFRLPDIAVADCAEAATRAPGRRVEGVFVERGRPPWKDGVRDGRLDATAVSLRPGKAPAEDQVVAGVKG